MSPQEEKILDNIKVNFNKYSIPFIWATSLVSLARKEGRIYDDYAVAVLNDVRTTLKQTTLLQADLSCLSNDVISLCYLSSPLLSFKQRITYNVQAVSFS